MTDFHQRTWGNAFTVWLTGLSGGGKSTLACGLKRYFDNAGRRTSILDGDDLRTGLCQDLGFSPEDRHENIRRASYAAKLLTEAGVIVLAAFITPYEQDRAFVRSIFRPGQLIVVHVDCPLDICQERDPKALYRQAQTGKIADFTGISSPYERPEHPDLRIRTDQLSVQQSLDTLWTFLQNCAAPVAYPRGEASTRTN